MALISVLDVAPVPEGGDVGEALRNSLSLARHAEACGYHRYWLAEHHNTAGIASSATAVLLAHAAARTSTIRVGAGGVVLTNHAPLVVAEQFGTLAALHPGRIDLGVVRGTPLDADTATALRRYGGADIYPDLIQELRGFFATSSAPSPVRAIPGEGLGTPIWVLGSSLYSAFLAADLGLPFAFASHATQVGMDEALAAYRRTFRPSAQLARPYVMACLQVFAADDAAAARRAMSSSLLAFFAQYGGRPGLLPAAVDLDARLSAEELDATEQLSADAVVGSPDTVRAGLAAFLDRTGADELMVTADIHDHATRLRSFELTAEAMRGLTGIARPSEVIAVAAN